MSGAVHVLVTFACQNGSTAGIAETIATTLREAGLQAECRPTAAVRDLAPYSAVILGSGVFLARRRTDGGGFLARHLDELGGRPLWLFSAGPIGGAPGDDDSTVVQVARAVGARGAAAFGTARLQVAADDGGLGRGDWRDVERVRAWAMEIARALRVPAGFAAAS
jgi:menaquinone-dependent protoporphyrinogen oxidase